MHSLFWCSKIWRFAANLSVDLSVPSGWPQPFRCNESSEVFNFHDLALGKNCISKQIPLKYIVHMDIVFYQPFKKANQHEMCIRIEVILVVYLFGDDSECMIQMDVCVLYIYIPSIYLVVNASCWGPLFMF